MGRLNWGVVGVSLMLAGCVTPYGERIGPVGPTAPTPAAPIEAAPTPVAETASPLQAIDEETEPEAETEKVSEPSGIDVNWSYYAGKAADQQLGALGGPEQEEQLGSWKCTISKQETGSEGSSPVSRKRTIHCKNWGDAQVGTSVTCDTARQSNDVLLMLGNDAIVVACEAK